MNGDTAVNEYMAALRNQLPVVQAPEPVVVAAPRATHGEGTPGTLIGAYVVCGVAGILVIALLCVIYGRRAAPDPT
jgi:hypothetical protein